MMMGKSSLPLFSPKGTVRSSLHSAAAVLNHRLRLRRHQLHPSKSMTKSKRQVSASQGPLYLLLVPALVIGGADPRQSARVGWCISAVDEGEVGLPPALNLHMTGPSFPRSLLTRSTPSALGRPRPTTTTVKSRSTRLPSRLLSAPGTPRDRPPRLPRRMQPVCARKGWRLPSASSRSCPIVNRKRDRADPLQVQYCSLRRPCQYCLCGRMYACHVT